MKKFLEKYAEDTEGAEERKRIFHIDLAAKYCNFFVCFHPFEDDNGRLGCLRVNAILLKYAGTVVIVGGNAAGKRMYIEEAVKANKEFTKEEYGDIPWEEQTSHRRLGAVILQKILQQMWILEV